MGLYEGGDSARAQLIKTRHGTWVDESLFPAARRECLAILQRVAYETSESGIVEMLRGEEEGLEGTPLVDKAYDGDFHSLMWAAKLILREAASKYELREEREAYELARNAPKTAGFCGGCSRKLSLEEPAYYGAEVYVGMPPFWWNMFNKPRLAEPRYSRTVLCGSCAPDWLSPWRDGVVTQVCGNCERPMVQRLKPSKFKRRFCSDPCREAHLVQIRKESRAQARKKVCKVCREEFTATRQDAETCSKACKQKAYRQRRKEVKQDR